VRVVLLPEPEAPDSFARSHTASEVQAYIRDHERGVSDVPDDATTFSIPAWCIEITSR